MQKLAVVIFVVLCCCRVPSTLAKNVTEDGGKGLDLPAILTEDLPTIPPDTDDKLKDAWNNSVRNFTNLLYDDCNITSCNPMDYKHCYEDKVPQLVIHAIAIILGIVFAFFGKELNTDISIILTSRLL